MTARRVAAASLVAVALALAGCAAHRLTLPEGSGQPFPGYREAFEAATRGCRDAATMTAEVGVSGRVNGQKLRGRVIAGFSRPAAALRLEGVAPFGPPAFILVSTGGDATLLLPRDRAVLRGQPPEAIIQALVGLPLSPAMLQAVLSGCGLSLSEPVAGVSFAGGWLRVEGEGGITTFMRQLAGGQWTVQAAVDDRLHVEYEDRTAEGPGGIRLRLQGSQPATELQLKVTQVELDVPLGPEAFTVKVPPDAGTITLDELRRAW